jgi:protein-L-isoaspartate(D-aspartate) O-methyltransferase
VSDPEALARAIATSGVRDPRLLDALRGVPRAGFVPPELPERAYVDRPLPIPHGQVTTQPSLSAKMIEALSLTGHEHVLEIGTGYGFQTALLAVLAREVVSVERYELLADEARANLREAGVLNADVYVGDGWEGWPERSPYDAMVVSAAAAEIPRALVAQLRAGGRLVVPLKRGRSDDVVALVKGADDEVVEERLITPARFVPLVRGTPDA